MTKLFIVNLQDSAARRNFMIRQLDKLGLRYEFVRAIEANDIDDDLVSQVNSREIRGGPMEKGEIACVLSHKKACERVAQDDSCDYGVVLEDDVVLKEGFAKAVAHFSNGCPEFRVTLLYSIVHRPVHFKKLSDIVKPYCLVNASNLSSVWGAQAYLLSSSQAQLLADRMGKIECRADNWEHYVECGAAQKVMTVFPFPVLHAEFNSELRRPQQKRQTFSRKAISETIHRHRIFPLFQVALFFRRLKAEARQRGVIFIDGKNAGKTFEL